MNKNDQVLLNDMLDFSRRVQKRVNGKHFSDLAAEDYLLGDAVVRALEVVGEAANHVTTELQTRYPEIEWNSII